MRNFGWVRMVAKVVGKPLRHLDADRAAPVATTLPVALGVLAEVRIALR